jgi:hypothetical protein
MMVHCDGRRMRPHLGRPRTGELLFRRRKEAKFRIAESQARLSGNGLCAPSARVATDPSAVAQLQWFRRLRTSASSLSLAMLPHSNWRLRQFVSSFLDSEFKPRSRILLCSVFPGRHGFALMEPFSAEVLVGQRLICMSLPSRGAATRALLWTRQPAATCQSMAELAPIAAQEEMNTCAIPRRETTERQ